MAEDRVDPAYEYIDGKVKLLNRKIRQLKEAHDAVTAQNRADLLDLQRVVAYLKVNSDTAAMCDIIRTETNLRNRESLRTELLAQASAVKANIKTSDNPLTLSGQFTAKWSKRLTDLGADFVTY